MPFMPRKHPVITMVFTEDLLDQVEAFRLENGIMSRSEAIRVLLRKGFRWEKAAAEAEAAQREMVISGWSYKEMKRLRGKVAKAMGWEK